MVVPDPMDNEKKPIEYLRMLDDENVRKFFLKILPYLTNLKFIIFFLYIK